MRRLNNLSKFGGVDIALPRILHMSAEQICRWLPSPSDHALREIDCLVALLAGVCVL
jgi:hypothetical protein